MSQPQRLAHYIKPSLPEARIAHQWAKLVNSERHASRLRPRVTRAFAYSLAFASVVAMGAYLYRAPTADHLTGAVVDTGPSGTQSVTLADGSRFELSPESQLVIDESSPSTVQLSLRRGKAQLEVTHRQGRSFRVLAGAYEISVVGTRFSVSLEKAGEVPRLSVEVEQGKVKVRRRAAPQDERILSGGESWAASAERRDEETTRNPEAIATDQQNQAKAAEAAAASALVEPVASVPNAAPSVADSSAGVSAVAHVGPKELLEKAELLRISGKARESAEVLDRLRKSFRADRRAGLAAFELGRLRMDVFGDLAGSLEALTDAIQLSPKASFREDAESRLVQILYRQGNLDRCRAARLDYLKHFPSGAAIKVVSRLCEP